LIMKILIGYIANRITFFGVVMIQGRLHIHRTSLLHFAVQQSKWSDDREVVAQ